MFSKKDFTFIVFFFFVARIKFIQGNLENNEMYHSQILIYWQLCWRESSQEQKKEKLRIELRFKELWNKSIRLFRFMILIEELLVNPWDSFRIFYESRFILFFLDWGICDGAFQSFSELLSAFSLLNFSPSFSHELQARKRCELSIQIRTLSNLKYSIW